MFNISLLYVGPLGNKWQNSRKHWDILKRITKFSACVDLDELTRLDQRRWLRRIDGNAFSKANIEEAAKKVLEAVACFKPDVIWFEKPLLFDSQLILEIKKISPTSVTICRQDDNPFGLRSKEKAFWKRFISAIPYYDIHFVKRDQDRINFLKHGAKNIRFFWSGYDAEFFYPPSDSYPVKDLAFSFIGTNMDGRGKFIFELQKKLKVNNFFVGGRYWNRSLLGYKFPKNVHNSDVSDIDLRNIFLRSHACLGLYSTSNQDEFSGRAFMISGCGATLVAPRSKMHEFFFKDGKEALFFEDVDRCA